MTMYATPTDLTDVVDVDPERAARLLYHAGLLVALATRGARYDVDRYGVPILTSVREAMRDATVNQAAAWAAAGVDPDKPGSTGARQKASVSIGGGSVSYVGVAEEVAEVAASRTALVAAAAAPLIVAGLLRVSVRTA